MLNVGDSAPDFKVKTHQGQTVSLGSFKGKKIVLWFFPKADTPGWTLEGCGFRDRIQKFEAKKAVVLGVSFDTEEENRKFAEKFQFPFPLLCDVKRDLGVACGACADPSGRNAARIGYVISEDGKILKAYPKVDAKNFPETVLAEI